MSLFRAIGSSNIYSFFTNSRISVAKLNNISQPILCCLGINGSFRNYSVPGDGQSPAKKSSSFDSMINQRRSEARRSVLVQVQSENSYPELFSYCSQYGSVECMHHYSVTDDMQFILVQFASVEDVAHILDVSGHISRSEIVPVSSPLLWFRAKGGGSSLSAKPKRKSKQVPWDPGLPAPNYGSVTLPQEEILTNLSACNSLSEQIEALYTASCLDELGSRLRFLTAHQLELALRGLFPDIKALPFGSSVNSFGRKGSDLDLCLQLDGHNTKRKSGEEGAIEAPSIRLVFQTKMIPANGRAQMQRQMETVGDILQLFLPGCSHVRRILQARVPIVKYRQDLTALDCDVTMTNLTAVYMSELLWIMGSLDPRVCPLVFFVRHWARAVDLTNNSPGPYVTNFTLALMVIHYLQSCKPHPVLPSLTTLISMAAPEDRRVSDDGISCTFVRDISRVPQSKNIEPLHVLLHGFFDFYSSFDYHGRGLSLVKGHGDKSGIGILKPDASPLYIENPLERMLNVTKNVSGQELQRLKIELRNAAWTMEEIMESSDEETQKIEPKNLREMKSSSKESENVKPWGLMGLLRTTPSNTRDARLSVETMMKISARGRLVKVTDLFEGSGKEDSDLPQSAEKGIMSATAKESKR